MMLLALDWAITFMKQTRMVKKMDRKTAFPNAEATNESFFSSVLLPIAKQTQKAELRYYMTQKELRARLKAG